VPDLRKGERLILLTQKKDATRSEVQTALLKLSEVFAPACGWYRSRYLERSGAARHVAFDLKPGEMLAEIVRSTPKLATCGCSVCVLQWCEAIRPLTVARPPPPSNHNPL
jgi:hypothetical protein